MENKLNMLSVTEIKAMVYDELAKIELIQNNIRILNQELRNRIQPKQNSNEEVTSNVNFSDSNV